jgi:hypothetical protein
MKLIELSKGEIGYSHHNNKIIDPKDTLPIKNDKNYGFAEGNNIRIRYALLN